MAPPSNAAKPPFSPSKLDHTSSTTAGPAWPEKVVVKAKNNVLEQATPNMQLAAKIDALSLSSTPNSPTKRVYHSPAKENSLGVEKPQITLRPSEDDTAGMSEQAKKSLRSINALRGLTIEEIDIINRPEVKRLATVAQLCMSRKDITADIDFIDHYFDLLTYLADRKRRLEIFKASHPLPIGGTYTNGSSAIAWKDYCGRERAALRKRRTKTKCNDFSILSQIGQGGYGQVFLARKKDTGEVVALKKMNVLFQPNIELIIERFVAQNG